MRVRVDAGMERPAVGNRVAVALDRIVEAEAGTAQVAAGTADRETVVEAGGGEVPDVPLRRERLDSLGPELRIAAPEAREVVDARELEPDQVDGVVHDSLGVGLGEAHANVGGEVEVHKATLGGFGGTSLGTD